MGITNGYYNMLAKAQVALSSAKKKAEAQGLIEYALIAALIAVALIAVLQMVATTVGAKFNLVSETLDNTKSTTVEAHKLSTSGGGSVILGF